MRQSACSVINPITVDILLPSLIARRFGRASDDGPNIKLVDLFKLVGTGLSLVCCLVIRGSTDFFGSGISVVLFHTLGFSGCHNTFVSSPNLWLIIGHVRDLFIPSVDSLMS